MIRITLATIGALALSISAPLATAQQSGQATATGPAEVQVEQKDPFGRYLTDADGRALDMFTADSRNRTKCYEACADAWPPLVTQGEPEEGEEADAAKLGTIERKNGEMQVTYNGWPLYYFVKDRGAGTTAGQDVHGFGGEWYLLDAEGDKVQSEDAEQSGDGG